MIWEFVIYYQTSSNIKFVITDSNEEGKEHSVCIVKDASVD